MKCEACGKDILYKKDLYAGPRNPKYGRSGISISALLGKDIKTYHKDCYKKLPTLQKMGSKTILAMNGWYGNAVIITPIILFAIVFLIFLFTRIISLDNLWIVAVSLIILLIGFEIPLIRLRSKIKSEYEDKLQ